MTQPTVSWSRRHQEAAGVLLAAFATDPTWSMAFATRSARRRVLRRLLPPLAADAAHEGGLLTATIGDVVVGAACVWAPGFHPAPRPTLSYLLAGAALLRQAGVGSLAVLARWRAIRAADPRADHWHLALLGVHPASQRQGVGSALLGGVVERADCTREAAYLETGRLELVGWYESAGFVVREELALPGGRAAWTMWRSPARPR